MPIAIEAAEARLPELIDAALAGEEVTLLRDGRRVARLTPIPQSGFRLGLLEGRLGALPDFLAPLTADREA